MFQQSSGRYLGRRFDRQNDTWVRTGKYTVRSSRLLPISSRLLVKSSIGLCYQLTALAPPSDPLTGSMAEVLKLDTTPSRSLRKFQPRRHVSKSILTSMPP